LRKPNPSRRKRKNFINQDSDNRRTASNYVVKLLPSGIRYSLPLDRGEKLGC
jgi:hypothetical protein